MIVARCETKQHMRVSKAREQQGNKTNNKNINKTTMLQEKRKKQ
jgi:hypothetical protein